MSRASRLVGGIIVAVALVPAMVITINFVGMVDELAPAIRDHKGPAPFDPNFLVGALCMTAYWGMIMLVGGKKGGDAINQCLSLELSKLGPRHGLIVAGALAVFVGSSLFLSAYLNSLVRAAG
jgi:hypothetical protein